MKQSIKRQISVIQQNFEYRNLMAYWVRDCSISCDWVQITAIQMNLWQTASIKKEFKDSQTRLIPADQKGTKLLKFRNSFELNFLSIVIMEPNALFLLLCFALMILLFSMIQRHESSWKRGKLIFFKYKNWNQFGILNKN